MDIGAAAGIWSLPHKMLDYPSRAHAPENVTPSSSSSLVTCWSLAVAKVHFLFLKMCDLWRPTSNDVLEVISKCMLLNYFHKTPCRDSWRKCFVFCSLLTPNTISQTPSRHPYCTSKTTYQINPTCWGKLNQATSTEKIAVMMWGINATKIAISFPLNGQRCAPQIIT